MEHMLDTIHHGDVRELFSALPAESIDLIVSSPPYNLGKEYESKRALAVYLDEQAEVLRACTRVLKQTGSLFWQVGAFADNGTLIPLDIRFFSILESCGLVPRNRIIWVRPHGVHARRKFSCRHETILWFTKSDDYVFDLDAIRVPQKYQNKKHWRGDKKGELSGHPDGKNPGDIWMFQNVKHNHEEQTIHPCAFPEDLITRIMLPTTKPGDIVLDPYMGSGTVAVVARDFGRHYLGAETDARYHSVAIRRLSGLPDGNNSFPNLKTLRQYAAKTGEPVGRYRFDVQVAAKPTAVSRIFSEEHHLDEMEERLLFEEAAFAARARCEPIPAHPTLNGKRRAPNDGPSLFDLPGDLPA